MTSKLTPAKFKAIVKMVYASRPTDLPTPVMTDFTDTDIFDRKKVYKGVRVVMYDLYGSTVHLRYIRGYAEVLVGDSNGMYALRKWTVPDLNDFSRVIAAAALILKRVEGASQ